MTKSLSNIYRKFCVVLWDPRSANLKKENEIIMDVSCKITRIDGTSETVTPLCLIDTADEVEYYRHGGILQYVLRNLKAS